MASVLMPLAEGFEEIEALTVVDILRRADIEVVLAGLFPGPVTGAHDIRIIPDMTIDAVSAETFDMIILPGGQPGTNNLNGDQRIHALLREFSRQQKLIGAICAAPIVLATAGLLSGVHATCYPTYRSTLKDAVYVDSPVVCDGTLITSKGPGTAMSFGFEIAARLAGRHVADAVAKAMLVEE